MRAKSSGTTSIATISAPASSARWASRGPEASSASRRETLLETVMTTVRTAPDDSRARRRRLTARPLGTRTRRRRRPRARQGWLGRVAHPVAAAPARLAQQLDGLDAHAALEALDHVVDRERGDGGGGHCLHLDAGAGGDRGGGGQRDRPGGGIERRVD